MFSAETIRRRLLSGAMLTLAFVIASGEGQAENFNVIHDFAGPPSDGATPVAGLVSDKAGNLYGTTEYGGGAGCKGFGCGAIFSIAPNGAEIVLYPFLQSQGLRRR
jgi:uncharacterized repeat protein (TIGR03803 family)